MHGSLGSTLSVGGNASAPIQIDGNMGLDTLGDVQGAIQIGGELNGRIQINGSLLNGPADYDIQVGSMPTGTPPTNAIVVDYDGWHVGDDWASGARVCVGAAPPYGGNTPSMRIYEITPCKGDMNNDGVVDSADEAGFILARDNPTGYAAACPGLDGRPDRSAGPAIVADRYG